MSYPEGYQEPDTNWACMVEEQTVIEQIEAGYSNDDDSGYDNDSVYSSRSPQTHRSKSKGLTTSATKKITGHKFHSTRRGKQ